jgi:hypothetical protein
MDEIATVHKAKISVFYLMSFIAVFFFQRYKMEIRRSIFLHKLESKEVFSLLHKLMRVYHDGILLTNEKEIIFKNKIFSKLMLLE